jgi:hypothetical protein
MQACGLPGSSSLITEEQHVSHGGAETGHLSGVIPLTFTA